MSCIGFSSHFVITASVCAVVRFVILNSFQVEFWLDNYTSAEELESLGLDRLKQELMTRGLKCGGTLQQRAQRLFATKGVPLDQLDPSFFAKPSGSRKSNGRK